MKNRKEGFYWVKPVEDSEWMVAMWIPDYNKWIIVFIEDTFDDSDFAEIDERHIIRETAP